MKDSSVIRMKKRKWLILTASVSVIVVLFGAFVGIMNYKSLGFSTGRYLEAKNGVSMLILDNSPIQMSDRTNSDLFEKLETGDKILVLHDGIAESYPGRTGAYAVFKQEDGTIDDISQDVLEQLTEMGWLSNVSTYAFTIAGEALDVAVAYANWTDDEKIYNSALNADKILADSVHHYPIYKFDTLEDLEQFKRSFGDVLTMDHGYNEIPSFHEVSAKYDKTFFEENTLLLVYVGTNSGSLRFGVDRVSYEEPSLVVQIEQTNNPEVVTEDMAGWFVMASIHNSMLENCTEFDAN